MDKFAHIQPWYRQFWPWFIIALPLTAVIASIATLIIAAHDPDGLVADDYYKQGLAINQTLDRERRAQTLGLSGLLRVDTSTQRISLTLEGPLDARDQKDMVLRMIHPTRPNLDRTLTLNSDGHGDMVGCAGTRRGGSLATATRTERQRLAFVGASYAARPTAGAAAAEHSLTNKTGKACHHERDPINTALHRHPLAIVPHLGCGDYLVFHRLRSPASAHVHGLCRDESAGRLYRWVLSVLAADHTDQCVDLLFSAAL